MGEGGEGGRGFASCVMRCSSRGAAGGERCMAGKQSPKLIKTIASMHKHERQKEKEKKSEIRYLQGFFCQWSRWG